MHASTNEVIEKEEEEKRGYYKEMKEYFLTYLECCYEAFIAVFIGIVAVPFLPISHTLVKGIMVVGFWIVGLHYLASIIYVYGQLSIAYELSDEVVEKMSHKVVALGFPYTWLERVFKPLRKRRVGRLNAKYVGILLGYLLLLMTFFLILLS